jgi:hypothetical protein
MRMAQRKAKARANNADLGLTGEGVAPLKIKELDRLAGLYVRHRDDRIEALRDEVTAKQNLLESLHEHADQIKLPDGTLVYHYDEMRISVTPGKEKLKVEPYVEAEVT